MIKHNQDGAVSGLAVSLGFTILLLIGAMAFGGWAFASRADYKSNTDTKIEDAVIIAKQQEGSAKDAQFLQDEKKPLRTYKGPEAFGSIDLSYPKTWSGYVDDKGKNTSALVDGYFFPNVVPSIVDESSVFAVRIQVLGQPYAQVLTAIKSSTTGSATATAPAPVIAAYALPKIPTAVGVKITGSLPNGKQGVMVVLPLRSQTIQLWAETGQFTPDFENLILPNFSFIP